MFCWQARRRLADLMDAAPGSGLARARAHVDSCPGCKAELRALSGVAEMVGTAGRSAPSPLTDPIAFEQAVFRRARNAAAKPTLAAEIGPRAGRWHGLVPISSAAAIMALAVAASLLVRTPSGDGIPLTAPVDAVPDIIPDRGAEQEISDVLAPARQIPFTIQEDLVGERTGTIPATTYVLEPAPIDQPVIRASL